MSSYGVNIIIHSHSRSQHVLGALSERGKIMWCSPVTEGWGQQKEVGSADVEFACIVLCKEKSVLDVELW